jgi:hypothetical protein
MKTTTIPAATATAERKIGSVARTVHSAASGVKTSPTPIAQQTSMTATADRRVT